MEDLKDYVKSSIVFHHNLEESEGVSDKIQELKDFDKNFLGKLDEKMGVEEKVTQEAINRIYKENN